MKIYFRFILVLALIFTSSNIYAADSDEMQRSGFLSTYDGLKQSDEYMVEYAFINENVDFKSYDKIILDYMVKKNH